MRSVSHRAAPLAGAALVLALSAALPAPAHAQFQRIVPPPPCVIPADLQIRRTARAATDRNPLVVVELLDVTNAERRVVHLPMGLTARLRDRLRALPGVSVVAPGTFERALYESGGSADSAATLIGADWMLRGRAQSTPGGTALTVTLVRRGEAKSQWEATYTIPPRSLASVELAVMEELAARLPRKGAALPPIAAGAPRLATGDEALALGDWLLRDPSAATADSARRLLERAFGADTASTQLAMALAKAYLATVIRGGVKPPVSVVAAVRRVDDLTTFALARNPKLAAAWTARAVAARLRDTVAFAGALEAHARALALAPRSADDVQELANTYLALGQFDKAASELRRVLAIDHDRGSALAALAGIELRSRRFREACAYANAAVAAAPFDARAYAVRARARVVLGQARDAYADAETAARLSNAAWTKGLRLLTEIGAGNEDAAKQISRLLANEYLAPQSQLTVEDATMLATAWVRLGETKKATLALSRAQPRGRLLLTQMRDPVFAPLRDDSTYRALMASTVPKGTDY